MISTTVKQPRWSHSSLSSSEQDAGEDASRVWLPEIVRRISALLPCNEVACTLRLVSRATAQQFSERAMVRPAQPVPRWCFGPECRRVCRGLTLKERRKLLCLTAASGDVANLDAAVAETGCPLTVEGLYCLCTAAGAGQLQMCQWLVGPGRVPWNSVTARLTAKAAAEGGHGHLVDWCLEARAGVSPGLDGVKAAVLAALCKGHEGLAWRLMEGRAMSGTEWWGQAVCVAAEGCSLAGLQRACERLLLAGAGGQLQSIPGLLAGAFCSPTADWKEKCEFLLAKGCVLSEDPCETVCMSFLPKSAMVERLAWLQAQGAVLTADAFNEAAGRGDAALVSYFLERGLVPSKADLLEAAFAGCLPALQALVAAAPAGAVNLPLIADILAGSASLAGLSWLVETYGAEAIGGLKRHYLPRACSTGNVELMAWLLARGCEADKEAWEAAAGSGCEAALELLSERGCPKPADGSPYLAAAEHGDVRTMAVLRRLRFSFGTQGGRQTFTRVAGLAPDAARALPGLTWLHSSGCEVDWAEVERVAAQGYTSLREALQAWLAEHKPRAGGPEAAQRQEGPGGSG